MKKGIILLIYTLIFVLLVSFIQLEIKNTTIKEQEIQITELKKELIEKEDTIDRINQQLGIYDR